MTGVRVDRGGSYAAVWVKNYRECESLFGHCLWAGTETDYPLKCEEIPDCARRRTRRQHPRNSVALIIQPFHSDQSFFGTLTTFSAHCRSTSTSSAYDPHTHDLNSRPKVRVPADY